jgi:histidinol-phosphate aminotransferase
MPITRRTLLERLGAAAAASMIAPRASAASRGSLPRASAASRGAIRLHRNENAYGPSPAALAALRDGAASVAGRYPEIEADSLRRKIADLHGVAPDQVVLGCGSTDILRMAAETLAGPQKKVIAASPTFDGIALHARRAGAEVVDVPLQRDYSHDIPAMLAASDAATGLIYICNPNTPTGTLTPRPELERLLHGLSRTMVVLIDEAYHHYVAESPDYASFIDRPVKDDRVVVTRSFSKIYGLAGLRVGYAIAAPAMARLLASRQLADGISAVAARAAAAAVDDVNHVRTSVSRNIDDRQEFVNQAISRMLRPVDAQGNFFMVNTGGPAADVVEHLAKQGILVAGPFAAFETAIRVSLGTAADMREFWRAWDLMPARGHHMSRA